jgi:hypothetical protein
MNVMAKWSNVEKNVGPLAAIWPKSDSEVSHWSALHQSIGTLRGLMDVLDNAFEAIDQNADLSPSGRTRKRTAEAESVLKELEDFEPLRKASSAVARRIEKLREKMTALPGSESGVDVHVAAEIRAVIRAKPEPEKFARELLGDPKTMGSILNTPAFLSGMSEEALERLRTWRCIPRRSPRSSNYKPRRNMRATRLSSPRSASQSAPVSNKVKGKPTVRHCGLSIRRAGLALVDYPQRRKPPGSLPAMPAGLPESRSDRGPGRGGRHPGR